MIFFYTYTSVIKYALVIIIIDILLLPYHDS